MRVEMLRYFILIFFSIMVGFCHTNLSCGDIISQDEECVREAQDEEKKSQETLEKAEVENKEVQPLRLRPPRSPDVSVIYW